MRVGVCNVTLATHATFVAHEVPCICHIRHLRHLWHLRQLRCIHHLRYLRCTCRLSFTTPRWPATSWRTRYTNCAARRRNVTCVTDVTAGEHAVPTAPLVATHYPRLTTRYQNSRLTTHYSLPTTHYPPSTIHYLPPTTHYSLPTAYCLLPTTYYLLLTTHCSLPNTHYSQADLLAEGDASPVKVRAVSSKQ